MATQAVAEGGMVIQAADGGEGMVLGGAGEAGVIILVAVGEVGEMILVAAGEAGVMISVDAEGVEAAVVEVMTLAGEVCVWHAFACLA